MADQCLSYSPRSPLSSLSTPDDLLHSKGNPDCGEPNPCDSPVEACDKPAAKPQPVPAQSKAEYAGYGGYKMKNSAGTLIVWFIIIFVVAAIALYALKPTFVLKKDCLDVDNGKVLLSAFIIALFIVLLIWIIMALVSRGQK